MAKNPQISIKTPLISNRLVCSKMWGVENIGSMFRYELSLHSKNESVGIDDILGKMVTVEFRGMRSEPRFFNGIVSSFSQAGQTLDRFLYRMTLSPWLCLLTGNARYRIFQQQTAVQIIESIFSETDDADFEIALTNEYRRRDYCVQYAESDFDFVNRLMEEEGIYYFFRHKDDSHTLILADNASAHAEILGGSKLPFLGSSTAQTKDREHVSHWVVERDLSRVDQGANNAKHGKPTRNQPATQPDRRRIVRPNQPLTGFREGVVGVARPGGRTRPTTKPQQIRLGHATGTTNAQFLAAGGLFTLLNHPRSDQNARYLVTETAHTLSVDKPSRARDDEGTVCRCEFTAIDSATRYQPAQSTPRPIVSGPQTAVVVGPPGEEIHPDELGRVKVKFPWDRDGNADDHSSCWIRVAQPWAGNKWGTQFIPRIGQEVVVDFLEGDPDQPIITGSLYSTENRPPYALPANKTRSGIKSQSTQGGTVSNFNELCFEDKQGAEEVQLKAEKDYTQQVKNNQAESVGKDRSLDIGRNSSERSGKDRSISVQGDASEDIGKSKSTSVGRKYQLDVGDEITLSAGQASITLKKDGTIMIKGKDILISASGKVDVKGAKSIVLKSTKTLRI